MSRLAKLRTLAALGPANLARVGFYRLGLRSGRHPVQKLRADPAEGPFFDLATPVCTPVCTPASGRPGAVARQDWQPGQGRAFGRDIAMGARPDWHAAPLTGGRADADRPWWRIPDFDPAVGDIKTVWEPSRLDWLLPLAQRAALGAAEPAARLEDWLADWSRQNRPYCGANWKCGQEASIRVLHLAAASVILGQDGSAPEKGLRDLLALHLRRIAPTMGYAIGQANNHGTSEAAALFVGGSWLGGAEGRAWARTGRRWLEDRAQVLIAPDGSFSQYSVTYHRLMLDSYALAEVWRGRRDLPAFSARLRDRLSAATGWLEQMTDPASGDAPNLGANDGAQILALTGCGYRDFRPSVQLASALFRGNRAYEAGPWDQQALWLDVDLRDDLPDARAPKPASRSLDDGGLHVLRRGGAVAYLRYPRFRFRPAQADALHLDLWRDGVNLLPDAGTYSYNVSAEDTAYFNGTRGHNTVEFDGRDQMPRLGRFLFGNWLRARDVALVQQAATDKTVTAAAGYRDHLGASHHRRVTLGASTLRVEDTLAGFAGRAVLRWRLAPGDWTLTDNGVQGRPEGADQGAPDIRLAITASVPVRKITLTQGLRSLYYLEKSPLPVLEVAFDQPGQVTTDIHF